MLRLSIQSNAIASIGYDEKSRTLEIEFLSGNIYRYFKVPPKVAGEFMHPDDGSYGKYFQEQIRDNYEFEKK